MIQILIDFDEVNNKVIRTKIIKSSKSKKIIQKPIVELLDNKITISDGALELIKAKSGDRISINYITIDNQTTYPLIGKSEVFVDKSAGNVLTKSNTVSFRGIQRSVLKEYGSFFILEPYKEDIYRLVPTTSDELISADSKTEELLEVEKLELEGVEEEIDSFNEMEDLLPF